MGFRSLLHERSTRRMRRPLLCWIDLETTGLEPQHDRILQAAIVVTDTELQRVAEPFETVIHRGPATLSLMNSHVREMHTQTGLLTRVENSRTRAEAAYSEMFAFVREHTHHASQIILAGSSVHFDRKFLARWVPRLEGILYHRLLDVSALKHLAEWWGFPQFEKCGTAHIALDDINNSIAELQFYREHMLREM
jgi:oligoribonuclease